MLKACVGFLHLPRLLILRRVTRSSESFSHICGESHPKRNAPSNNSVWLNAPSRGTSSASVAARWLVRFLMLSVAIFQAEVTPTPVPTHLAMEAEICRGVGGGGQLNICRFGRHATVQSGRVDPSPAYYDSPKASPLPGASRWHRPP